MSMEKLLSDGIKAMPQSFLGTILASAAEPGIISFAGGLPNPVSFPQEAILKSTDNIIKKYGSKVFQYSVTAGLPELRQYIADRYNSKYGLNLTSANVVITTGSQQALDLIGKTFLNKGDSVIVEKPTYLAAIQAFAIQQPEFVSVDLTDDGMDLKQLEEALKQNVKFLYAIPNFQNPTGLTYTAENKEKVYQLLKETDVIMVEDDPYGELRYEGEPTPYIGLGRLENSVVLGSFSKTITPGMRIGFIISENTELLGHILSAKEASDLHTNVFSQYLIYDYLMNNDLDEHIEKIKGLYKPQAQAMVEAMKKYFPETVKFTQPKGGMFLWVTLPEGVSALDLFPKALEKKVAFVPGDPFYTNVQNANTMRLNYTNADAATIDEGIRRLAECLKEL